MWHLSTALGAGAALGAAAAHGALHTFLHGATALHAHLQRHMEGLCHGGFCGFRYYNFSRAMFS